MLPGSTEPTPLWFEAHRTASVGRLGRASVCGGLSIRSPGLASAWTPPARPLAEEGGDPSKTISIEPSGRELRPPAYIPLCGQRRQVATPWTLLGRSGPSRETHGLQVGSSVARRPFAAQAKRRRRRPAGRTSFGTHLRGIETLNLDRRQSSTTLERIVALARYGERQRQRGGGA